MKGSVNACMKLVGFSISNKVKNHWTRVYYLISLLLWPSLQIELSFYWGKCLSLLIGGGKGLFQFFFFKGFSLSILGRISQVVLLKWDLVEVQIPAYVAVHNEKSLL